MFFLYEKKRSQQKTQGISATWNWRLGMSSMADALDYEGRSCGMEFGSRVNALLMFWYPPVNKHSNGKSPSWVGNTSSNGGFSIAMLDYRRVRFVPQKKRQTKTSIPKKSSWICKKNRCCKGPCSNAQRNSWPEFVHQKPSFCLKANQNLDTLEQENSCNFMIFTQESLIIDMNSWQLLLFYHAQLPWSDGSLCQEVMWYWCHGACYARCQWIGQIGDRSMNSEMSHHFADFTMDDRWMRPEME